MSGELKARTRMPHLLPLASQWSGRSLPSSWGGSERSHNSPCPHSHWKVSKVQGDNSILCNLAHQFAHGSRHSMYSEPIPFSASNTLLWHPRQLLAMVPRTFLHPSKFDQTLPSTSSAGHFAQVKCNEHPPTAKLPNDVVAGPSLQRFLPCTATNHSLFWGNHQHLEQPKPKKRYPGKRPQTASQRTWRTDTRLGSANSLCEDLFKKSGANLHDRISVEVPVLDPFVKISVGPAHEILCRFPSSRLSWILHPQLVQR